MSDSNILVLVRVRPHQISIDEAAGSAVNSPSLIVDEIANTISISREKSKRGNVLDFKFDRVLGPSCQQESLYKSCNLVGDVLAGINCCIIAYGQTSTGKSHAMVGSGWDEDSSGHSCGHHGSRSNSPSLTAAFSTSKPAPSLIDKDFTPREGVLPNGIAALSDCPSGSSQCSSLSSIYSRVPSSRTPKKHSSESFLGRQLPSVTIFDPTLATQSNTHENLFVADGLCGRPVRCSDTTEGLTDIESGNSYSYIQDSVADVDNHISLSDLNLKELTLVASLSNKELQGPGNSSVVSGTFLHPSDGTFLTPNARSDILPGMKTSTGASDDHSTLLHCPITSMNYLTESNKDLSNSRQSGIYGSEVHADVLDDTAENILENSHIDDFSESSSLLFSSCDELPNSNGDLESTATESLSPLRTEKEEDEEGVGPGPDVRVDSESNPVCGVGVRVGDCEEGWGIIPRSLVEMFDLFEAKALECEGYEFSVSCQIMQIYNEKVYDLLQDRRRERPLQLRESRAVNGKRIQASLYHCIMLLYITCLS